ncbi:hypothetical protein BN2497_13137 [Janthinobacterium sp. CG23_2]|nr:hypothetical protein BN2497_13137 [Janthinobacterium sp. CG23_2]CUU32966.1 hypothetical protein BN3177_13137 [Janthinobacterium sp. CG23_2]
MSTSFTIRAAGEILAQDVVDTATFSTPRPPPVDAAGPITLARAINVHLTKKFRTASTSNYHFCNSSDNIQCIFEQL